MDLHLIRKIYTKKSTIGELSVDGKFQCYILEDIVRPADAEKVYGKTAIPAGTYQIQITMSNRFQRFLPLLIGVPGFEGIRIHPGNTDGDTDGCLLPGKTQGKDFVGSSVIAFEELFAKMKASHDISITILDGR